MSACCDSVQAAGAAGRDRCPVNGRLGSTVATRTIRYHLREPWTWTAQAARYYFCGAADCAVVYYGDDGSTIDLSRLRTRVGVKDTSGDGPLCYCFGVDRRDLVGDPGIRDYVVAQTRAGTCACDVCNPSGRCCLKDFPRTAKRR